jgi:hypothetical protein
MMSPHRDHVRIAALAVAMGGMALVYGCSAPPAAPPTTEEAPTATAPTVRLPMSINELMVAWVDNASHVMWDVEKPGFAPRNDADWIELEDHATQLMAAGAVIQAGGTGPMDAVWVRSDQWQTEANALGNAGRAALAAAKARDLPGVIEANGSLTTSCENCHMIFKPDAPSEGILHQTPHSESHPHN